MALSSPKAAYFAVRFTEWQGYIRGFTWRMGRIDALVPAGMALYTRQISGGTVMYVTLMHTLRAFFGADSFLRMVLIVSLALLVLALAAAVTPAFRAIQERWRSEGGWRGSLASMGTGLFKALLLFVFVRLLVVAMHFQAQSFEQRYGRVTEKNRSAVLMKWGSPHEQAELSVTHTRKRVRVTRQIKPVADKSDITTESFWKDEAVPVQAIDGRMPVVISTREEVRDVDVPQKSIVSADVAIQIRNNPRQLGNANYAGYDDAWSMRYVLMNASDQRTTAHFLFPLPAQTGLFDDLYLRMDGSNYLDRTKSDENALGWDAEMDPGAQGTVEIGYRSRGLEHLRYIPRRMSQTGHYRVAMQVEGIPPDKLDYPIGSMPPAEKLSDLRGNAYTLTWKLDNALTSYDIGVKLPLAEQPRYHYARLMSEAPVALILLMLLLVLPRLILGVPMKVGTAAILGIAHFLLYTLMGHLADVLPGFAWPFALAAGLLTLVVAWFRLHAPESRLMRVQDVIGFGVLAVFYPLAVIDGDRTALWMQAFYLLLLVYVCGLILRVFSTRPDSAHSAHSPR
jgi:hypothetical protein